MKKKTVKLTFAKLERMARKQGKQVHEIVTEMCKSKLSNLKTA